MTKEQSDIPSNSCHWCGGQSKVAAVHLWDGADYCEDCASAVSETLWVQGQLGTPLTTSVESDDIRGRPALLTMAVVVSVLLSLFWGPILLLEYLAHHTLFPAIYFAFAFGFPVVFASVVLVWIGCKVTRARMPRTMTIENGEAVLFTSGRELRFPLRDCSWRIGSSWEDNLGVYLERSKGVLICLPDYGNIFCSKSVDSGDVWSDFFTLIQLPKK